MQERDRERERVTPEDVASFLRRFARFGAEASVETYLALFHREIRLFDDGMERPIGYDEIPEHIAGVLALVKGFRMQIERWRAREGVVFVEAHNGGEIAGSHVGWRSVYRIELAGSHVIDGRRYFDRAPLLARLAPAPASAASSAAASATATAAASVPPEGAVPPRPLGPHAFVEQLATAWREGRPDLLADSFREDAALVAPGLPRPLGRGEIADYGARLASRLAGAPVSVRRWAGDETLVFVEWQLAGGGTLSAPAPGIVDRFDLVAGRILAARSYFDGAAIDRFVAPGS